MLIYCTDNDGLTALEIIPNWFVTSKTFEMFQNALLTNLMMIHAFFVKVILFSNEMGVLGIDLEKTNLYDDNNFEDDPTTF